MQRRFAREAGDALKVAEEEVAQSDEEVETSEPPLKKKRGRASKEDCFFAQFDAFLAGKVKEMGNNFTSDSWKGYVS